MADKLVYHNLKPDKDKVIEMIRDAILKEERIIIALIFGSILRRNRIRDIDLAIYTDPKPDLRTLVSLGSKLEELAGIPVDVSPLAELAPCMRYKVMARGIRIVVRNERLFNELMSASFSECQDLKLLLAPYKRKAEKFNEVCRSHSGEVEG